MVDRDTAQRWAATVSSTPRDQLMYQIVALAEAYSDSLDTNERLRDEIERLKAECVRLQKAMGLLIEAVDVYREWRGNDRF